MIRIAALATMYVATLAAFVFAYSFVPFPT